MGSHLFLPVAFQLQEISAIMEVNGGCQECQRRKIIHKLSKKLAATDH